MTQTKYDFLVIGSGAAGSTAAITVAGQGKRVAMVETHKLGGTCLNYGCDPTKTMLEIARLLHRTHKGPKYGLQIPTIEFDWAGVQARVQQVILQMRGGTPEEARANLKKQGVELLEGEAHFVSAQVVQVGEQQIQATDILIATGTEAAVLPVEGLKETGFITNVEAVSLAALPQRMAIVGGGPIGIEFAHLFRRFGVEITVLEHSPEILDTEDQELAQMLCNLLRGEGIRLETQVELLRVQPEQSGKGKKLTFKCGERPPEELVVDEILLAVGRTPNIAALNLEAADVEISKKGINVDAMLRTNVPHIWAAGDVTGGYQFTHVAEAQAQVIAHNLTAKEAQPFDGSVIPWVTYTDPELAHVGQTEEQLRKAKLEYKVARVQINEVERAKINDEAVGMVKLLVGPDQKILGGHILAAGAGELLAPIVLAIHVGLTVGQLASTLLPYPTMAQALTQAAKQI